MEAVSWIVLVGAVLALLRLTAALAHRRPPQQLSASLKVVMPRTAARLESGFRWWKAILVVVGIVVSMTGLLYLLIFLLGWSTPLLLAALGGLVVCVSTFMAVKPLVSTWRGRGLACGYAIGSFGLWFLWPNWLTINLLAVSMIIGGINSLLAITSGFRWVSLILGGYVVYDVVNVYITGKIIEFAKIILIADWVLPILIIVPKELSLDRSSWGGMLGLGDITLPGFLIASAGLVAYRIGRMVILHAALAGYALGLILALLGILVMHIPQPALLYLYPCIMGAVVATAWKLGAVRELFGPSQQRVNTSAA